MYFEAYIDDNRVRFFDEQELKDIDLGIESHGQLVITDTTNGECLSLPCHQEQAASVFALMISGLDEGFFAEVHYETIGNLFDDVPDNLRPIP